MTSKVQTSRESPQILCDRGRLTLDDTAAYGGAVPRSPLQSLPPRSALLAVALSLAAGCGGAAQESSTAGPSPEAVRAYTEASLLSQSGKLPEAAARFDEATRLDPEAAQVWLAAARAHAALGAQEPAAERARKAMLCAPADADVASDAAAVLAEAGHVDEARRIHQNRAQAEPQNAAPWLRLAEIALDRAELEEAEEALKQATQRDPRSSEAWEKLGQVRARQGRTAQAAVAFDRCIELDPRRSGLTPLVLRMALDGGDFDVARRALHRMGGGKTTEAQASLLLAGMLQERGDPMSAVAELERALTVEPGNVYARLRLGALLADAKRWADADAVLEKIPAGHEQTANARRLRAFVNAEQGKLDAAWDLLAESRTAGADTPEVAAQQARIRRKQMRYADARAVLAEARQKWPDEADLAYLDAMIVQDQGDDAGSLALMTAVAERFPKHAGALNFVGFSWAEKGVRLAEAEAYIRRALETEPDDGAIVDSLGWVLFKRGDLKGARTQLERAIVLMPGEGELHFHLAEVLVAAGDRPAGLAALQKAIDLAAAGGPTSEASRKRWQQRLDALRKPGRGK